MTHVSYVTGYYRLPGTYWQFFLCTSVVHLFFAFLKNGLRSIVPKWVFFFKTLILSLEPVISNLT